MFLHWLVGMVYVFYFASFVLLLREVLRPGVLWFLRNLNDPDFHPVQEVRNKTVTGQEQAGQFKFDAFACYVALMILFAISDDTTPSLQTFKEVLVIFGKLKN